MPQLSKVSVLSSLLCLQSQQHGAALASIGSPKDQNTAHQAGTSPTSSDAQCAKRPVPAGAEDAECVVTKVSKHSVTASPGKESRDAKKDSEPKAQKTKKKITPTVVAPEAAPKRITPIIVCDDADDTDAAKAQASKKVCHNIMRCPCHCPASWSD